MSEELVSRVISSLNRGSREGLARPHKPVLWLAILNLMSQNYIIENKIYFDERLIKEFKTLFSEYALGDDLPQPSQPYFHLRSSGIWHHRIKYGEESYYNSLTTSGGGSKRIQKAIEYVYLDDEIYEALKNSQNRDKLRQALMELLRGEARGAV